MHDTEDAGLTLYATFITSSRKLANLRKIRTLAYSSDHNNQQTGWKLLLMLILLVREKRGYSSTTEGKIRRSCHISSLVPTAAVQLHIQWLPSLISQLLLSIQK